MAQAKALENRHATLTESLMRGQGVVREAVDTRGVDADEQDAPISEQIDSVGMDAREVLIELFRIGIRIGSQQDPQCRSGRDVLRHDETAPRYRNVQNPAPADEPLKGPLRDVPPICDIVTFCIDVGSEMKRRLN